MTTVQVQGPSLGTLLGGTDPQGARQVTKYLLTWDPPGKSAGAGPALCQTQQSGRQDSQAQAPAAVDLRPEAGKWPCSGPGPRPANG